MVDIAATSVAVVNLLAPFMPFLTKAGEAVGDKFREAFDKHGGDVAWQTAQKVWGKIKARLGGDGEVEGTTTLVAAQPENETYQDMLAKILAKRLAEDPQLAAELVHAVGGAQAVQSIGAENEAWIQDVEQSMAQTGRQEIHAGDRAVIKGAKQRMGGTGQ